MRSAGDRVVHLFSGFLSSDVVELARELMAVLPEPLERLMRLAIQRFRDELMEALRSSDSVLDAALAG